MKPSGLGKDICSIYAVTEKERPETLTIGKMLVLYEDGTNVVIVGDKSSWWRVPPGDEKFVKSLLLMIACRGEVKLMMKVPPDSVHKVTEDEFDRVLQKLEGEVATEQFRSAGS